MSTLDQDIEDAKKELRDWAKDNPDDTEPHDTIFEIADSSCPIYYSTILEYAANDTDLATSVPDIGPAFDGKATPVNIIASNIFERIEQELWDEWRLIEQEREEAEEEEAEEEE